MFLLVKYQIVMSSDYIFVAYIKKMYLFGKIPGRLSSDYIFVKLGTCQYWPRWLRVKGCLVDDWSIKSPYD